MNEQALTPYSFDASTMELSRNRADYLVSPQGGSSFALKRGVDFGVIPGLKQPSLYKSGAEKVCMSLGLCQHYEVVSKQEDAESGFFYFLMRCDLVKIVDGQEYIITTSYGSANTRERRCGKQSAFDGANSVCKMAQKRALVGAAIALGGLSSAFTQDIESESYTDAADVYMPSDPNAKISPKQRTFFYTVASTNGYTKGEAKGFLAAHGYNSASEILAKDLDALCEALREGKAQEAVT